MRKFLKGMLLYSVIAMIGVLLCGGSGVKAAPAPNLSSVQVVEVWSDGSPNRIAVDPNYPNSLKEDVTLQGSNLYLRTKFTGFPQWDLVFYRQGSGTGPLCQYTETKREAIGRIITGWYQTVKIPFKYLSSAPVICVTATSINSGGTYSAFVSNIHLQK